MGFFISCFEKIFVQKIRIFNDEKNSMMVILKLF